MSRIWGWFTRRPDDHGVRWSRRALTVASLLAIAETARLFARILSDSTIAIPRFEWFEVGGVTAAATLGAWAVGALALLSDRWRVHCGWLAWTGAAAGGLLDRQTLAGEVIYLVAVFSLLHWVHAVLVAGESSVAAAPLRAIQWQVSVVFAWTAFAKLNPIFLSGGILSVAFDGPVPWPEVLRSPAVLMGMAIATVLFEASLAVTVWLKAFRRVAIIGAALFHLFIVMFLSPTLALAAFAAVMSTGYILFAVEPWRPGVEPA